MMAGEKITLQNRTDSEHVVWCRSHSHLEETQVDWEMKKDVLEEISVGERPGGSRHCC